MPEYLYFDELKNISSGCALVKLPLCVFREDKMYIAYCPSLDLNGSGCSSDEAIDSFKTTIRMYLSYGLTEKTLIKDLVAHGWNVQNAKQCEIKTPQFGALLQNEVFIDILKNKEYQKLDISIEIPILDFGI